MSFLPRLQKRAGSWRVNLGKKWKQEEREEPSRTKGREGEGS
jgi:hypothetical protein